MHRPVRFLLLSLLAGCLAYAAPPDNDITSDAPVDPASLTFEAKISGPLEVRLDLTPQPVFILQITNTAPVPHKLYVTLGTGLQIDGGGGTADLFIEPGRAAEPVRIVTSPTWLATIRREGGRFPSTVMVSSEGGSVRTFSVVVLSDPCAAADIPPGKVCKVDPRTNEAIIESPPCSTSMIDAAAKSAPSGKHWEVTSACTLALKDNPSKTVAASTVTITVPLIELAPGQATWDAQAAARKLLGKTAYVEQGLLQVGIRISADRKGVDTYFQAFDDDYNGAWRHFTGLSNWTRRWTAPDGYFVQSIEWGNGASKEASAAPSQDAVNLTSAFVPFKVPNPNSIVRASGMTQTTCWVQLGGLVMKVVEDNDHYLTRVAHSKP